MGIRKFGTLLFAVIMAAVIAGCGSSDPQSVTPDVTEPVVQEVVEQEQNEESAQAEETGSEVPADADGTMTVRFLDVGQGNSTLIECDGRYMLVDGGDYDYASYVVAYLKKQGVESLDYMVVSHYDSDHLSGCVGALRAFDCDLVICPDYEGDTKTYDTFVNDLHEREIDYVHPEVGDTYTLGDAVFTIVCPEVCDYRDENDNSVGIRLQYGQRSFLVCGDAGEESEEDMLRSGVLLESDVYVAGHHGSGGSSTYDYLQEVCPKAIVISCGYDNSYGHPAKATMNRLKKTGADLYRTDLQGELIAVCDGTSITWNVDPSNDFRCGEDVVAQAQTGSSQGEDSSAAADSSKTTYILNTNSGKFHLPSCDSVGDMSPDNKKEVSSTISEMESRGYSPCKRCLD